jgi:hypothetical protein
MKKPIAGRTAPNRQPQYSTYIGSAVNETRSEVGTWVIERVA